ncbi:Isochorismatase family protein [Maioricimonas rarisocia]|uniref:Isochorismatase family protein n=1 Tax=Maioricimonas rarisocia TaxID=2528026 RepID=A0A517ZFK7_9PLAN|nr:isochorismatase family protein [Maioricimonas rarisocia]QDU41222.1 Isochorismatase family protein [Maioricimonas rarisocia]
MIQARSFLLVATTSVMFLSSSTDASEPAAPSLRTYRNVLTPIEEPAPLMADHPEYVQPIDDVRRYESPILVDDEQADLSVRAWRYSYNARGIIEIPNRIDGAKTAVVMVHPWGIDDGQGWDTPQPAGVAFGCTPEKNARFLQHAAEIVNPMIERLRERVGLVVYSLPGDADPIRTGLYRSLNRTPSDQEREEAGRQLEEKLSSFDYTGGELPEEIAVSSERPVVDYFRQFPGLDASPRYNNDGFWSLPIPVMKPINVASDDVVFYDLQGYDRLKVFLRSHGIQHVLLCGYATDMCVCTTAAGYRNLRQDFNVFLVGDATQATFPSNRTAAYATNQALSHAALDVLITQVSWVREIEPAAGPE